MKKKQKRNHIIRNMLIAFSLLSTTLVILGATFYQTAKVNINKTYAPLKNTASPSETNKLIKEGRPLAFLIMGVDSRQQDFAGRTDTLMVVTVNPISKKITMVSIPRDTFIPSQDNNITAFNKINALYVKGGADASIKAVGNLINIKIDHYMTLNFEGLKKLIDVLGGVTINSDMSFNIDGINFYEGLNTIDGKEALAYTRMRYDDPKGTYGRDKRQQQVIEAILTKLKTSKSISSYGGIMDALGNNVKTDLSWGEIRGLILNYNEAFGSIVHDSLHGQGENINGLSFQIISDREKVRVHNLVEEQLK